MKGIAATTHLQAGTRQASGFAKGSLRKVSNITGPHQCVGGAVIMDTPCAAEEPPAVPRQGVLVKTTAGQNPPAMIKVEYAA